MVEQDYIMRLIKEMVRALLKLIFHTDLDLPSVGNAEGRRTPLRSGGALESDGQGRDQRGGKQAVRADGKAAEERSWRWL